MPVPIRVAILFNRQIEIDGIYYRLADQDDIHIIGALRYGCQLAGFLSRWPTDILLADKATPAAQGRSNPFPVTDSVPDMLRAYPSLRVAVVSSQASLTDVREARRRGAAAYILKDDQGAWVNLGQVIRAIISGHVYYSSSLAEMMAVAEGESDELTPRQFEILSLLADHPDMTTFEVALRLGVAHSTVRNQLSQAYWRLGVRTRAAAIDCLQSLNRLAKANKE